MDRASKIAQRSDLRVTRSQARAGSQQHIDSAAISSSRAWSTELPLRGQLNTQNRLQVKDGIYSSIHIHHLSETESWSERFKWDHDSLKPYCRFRELFLERKFSSPHPKKTFTFLQLPPELRETIYRFALVFEPSYIELAARTNIYGANNNVAVQHHISELRWARDSIGLLRVCKDFHEEASPIFYGENQWRFTDIMGIYVLDTFLRQIGKTNQGRIRKIAMHTHWRGSATDHWYDYLPESQSRVEKMRLALRGIGLRPSKHNWEFNQHRCLKRIVRALEGHGTLRQLTLVLPDSFDINVPVPQICLQPRPLLLDPASFKQLSIRLMILHPPSEEAAKNPDLSNTQFRYPTQTGLRQLGVEIDEAIYDEIGHWPVEQTSSSGSVSHVDEAS